MTAENLLCEPSPDPEPSAFCLPPSPHPRHIRDHLWLKFPSHNRTEPAEVQSRRHSLTLRLMSSSELPMSSTFSLRLSAIRLWEKTYLGKTRIIRRTPALESVATANLGKTHRTLSPFVKGHTIKNLKVEQLRFWK